MKDNRVYDIDRDKLWLRITQTKKRRRLFIIWIPICLFSIGLSVLLLHYSTPKEQQVLNNYSAPRAEISQPKIKYPKKKSAHNTQKNIPINPSEKAKNLLQEKDQLFPQEPRVASIQESSLTTEIGTSVSSARDNDTTVKMQSDNEPFVVVRQSINFQNPLVNGSNQGRTKSPMVIKKRIAKPTKLRPLHSINYVIQHGNNLESIKVPNLAAVLISFQNGGIKNKFGLELFYGRGLSKYKSGLKGPDQAAKFPLGYSYDYGIALTYYTNEKIYLSFGIFESNPQNVIELNGFSTQAERGTRLRAFPYSANLFLKIGKQHVFNRPFYYALGLIYQFNEDVGDFILTARPSTTADFPFIGTESTVMHHSHNYGLSNEIGYNFSVLKQNLSLSLNYNAFFKREINGEVRSYSNINNFNVVGNYQSNGNTLSFRIKYHLRF